MDCRSPLGYWPVVFIIWFLKVKTSSNATEVNAWGKQKILNTPQRWEVFSLGEDKFWKPASQANFTLNQPVKVLRHLPWLVVPPGSELAAESPLSFPVTEEIPPCLAGSILRRDPTCGGAALQSTIWVSARDRRSLNGLTSPQLTFMRRGKDSAGENRQMREWEVKYLQQRCKKRGLKSQGKR